MIREPLFNEDDLDGLIAEAIADRDRDWFRTGYRMGERPPVERVTPIPRDIRDGLEGSLIQAYLGDGVVRDAVDRALAVCLAAGVRRGIRQLVVTCALAELEELLDRELDRRIAHLDREHERRAA